MWGTSWMRRHLCMAQRNRNMIMCYNNSICKMNCLGKVYHYATSWNSGLIFLFWSSVEWSRPGWAGSLHLQTNHWSDWPKTWLMKSIWDSSDLIKFLLYNVIMSFSHLPLIGLPMGLADAIFSTANLALEGFPLTNALGESMPSRH